MLWSEGESQRLSARAQQSVGYRSASKGLRLSRLNKLESVKMELRFGIGSGLPCFAMIFASVLSDGNDFPDS